MDRWRHISCYSLSILPVMALFSFLNALNIVSSFLTIFVASITFFWFYADSKLSYWKRRGVEQVSNPNLIFGHFKDAILFRTAPGWQLRKLHRSANRNSPFVGIYLFHKPCLLLRDPDIIKQILIHDFDNFTDRHFAGLEQKDSLGMKNLFGINNPGWKYLRRKITPSLNRAKLKQMFPIMSEIGANMIDYLNYQKVDHNGNRIIDAQELNYKYITDLIAIVALGTKIDSFYDPTEEFCKDLKKFIRGIKKIVALYILFFMPKIGDKIGNQIFVSSKFISKLFWNAMIEREETGPGEGDFIDSLIKLKNGKQNPVYKFEGDNLLYQSGIFVSGFETSAANPSYTLMELARNREYQQRAREDIVRAIDEHGWNYTAVKNMKYLDQCTAETNRLHPPMPIIDRITRNEYKIPGTDHILEAGTPIYISLYGIQHDPRFFEDPEIFNPERFRAGHQISEAYMPFGLGPRMCIGMEIAQVHAKVILSTILRDYEVYHRPKDKTELLPRAIFTVAADGIILCFKEL